MTKDQAQEFRARLLMISVNDTPAQATITPEQKRQRLVAIGETMLGQAHDPPPPETDEKAVRQ